MENYKESHYADSLLLFILLLKTKKAIRLLTTKKLMTGELYSHFSACKQSCQEGESLT